MGMPQPTNGIGTIGEDLDILATCSEAHALLRGLSARRGLRMPHNLFMAMCYLQAELTRPGGENGNCDDPKR